MEKSLSEQKKSLREQHLKDRLSIYPDDRRRWDEAIEQAVLSLPVVANAQKIFIYLARSGEVGTNGLVHHFLREGRTVLTPSPDIRALPHDGLFRISVSPGLIKPVTPTRCMESRVDDLDLILAPGIVWDKSGYRVGFGGGYFDRLLDMTRPDSFKIGLAYDSQVLDEVPHEPWDKSVDMVITPTAFYGRPEGPVELEL